MWVGIDAGRGVAFQQRALWYRDLDLELRHKTRFFGAAALTNRVLARLFGHHPQAISEASAESLSRLGAHLERFNVDLAESARQSARAGPALDRRLVQAEQRVAQIHWQARLCEKQRSMIEREINGLLNESNIACLLARLWSDSRDYCSVLTALRARLGGPLDFAVESHRIAIGCALIEQLSTGRKISPAIATLGGYDP